MLSLFHTLDRNACGVRFCANGRPLAVLCPLEQPRPCLPHPSSASPATQEYGSAVGFCDKALALDPTSIKALLRRSRAHTGRHEYGAAAADLASVRRLDPHSYEAAEQEAELQRTRLADRRKEQRLFADMFARDHQATVIGAGHA